MRITELDVVDPEIVMYGAWRSCDECGYVGPTVDMVHQYEDAWLCGPCHWDYVREHEERWPA